MLSQVLLARLAHALSVNLPYDVEVYIIIL